MYRLIEVSEIHSMLKQSPFLRIILSLTIASSMLFSSCAAQKAMQREESRSSQPSAAEHAHAPEADPQKERIQGISHIVKKGENLFRIAKTYSIDMNDIAKLNGITDPSRIEVGQPIFIPGAIKQLPVHIIGKESPVDYKGVKFCWPLSGKVSSHFGDKRNGHYHSGIDILAPYGMEIVASRSGVVIFSGYEKGYGRMVIIDHEDGSSTVYAHNSENCVDINDRVSQGDVVARVGSSGNASGSHIHFEIRVDEDSIDPIPHLE
jgi:murein DD-endopeptidase MepM/ murein hydrolase activator NlpD